MNIRNLFLASFGVFLVTASQASSPAPSAAPTATPSASPSVSAPSPFPSPIATPGAITTLDVPCEPCSTDTSADKTNGQSCHIGLGCCSDVKAHLISRFDKAIEQDRIALLYPITDPATQTQVINSCTAIRAAKGITTPFTIPPGDGVDVDGCTDYLGPTCDPLKGEVLTRNGVSCGNFLQISTAGANVVPPYGTLERSWMNGGWIESLRCYKTQLETQVQAGTITIQPDCQAMAQDIASLYSRAQSGSQQLCQQPDLQALAQGQDPCINLQTNFQQTQTFNAQTVTSDGQAACQLSTGVKDIHSAFVQLLVCNDLASARRSYHSTYVSPSGAFQTGLNADVAQPCVNGCLPGCTNALGIPDAGCVVSCTQSCYDQNSPTFIQKFFENTYQPGGKCSARLDGLFLPVLVGAVRRKRGKAARRKSKRAPSRKRKKLSLLAKTFTLLSLGFLSACGGGSSSNPPTVGGCQGPNGQTEPTSCCSVDSSNNTYVAIIPTPDGCAGSLGNLANVDSAAAGDATNARTAFDVAFGLNGNQGGQQAGGASIEAATAGGAPALGGSSGGSASPSGSVSIPSLSSDSGGGGSGAGGGASGPSLPAFNAPAPAATAVAQGTPNLGSDSLGAPSSAGGGHGGGGGGGDSPNPFGGLFGDNGAGAAGDDSPFHFGKRGPAGDIPAMVSMDPDDYFSRISAQMNLFKVVELRYQKQSLGWSQDHLKELHAK